MSEYWDMAIVAVALFGSIILAAVLLSRTRLRAKPEQDKGTVQVPASASRRQRRIMGSLESEPEIPTLMDMVRQEIAELGIEDVPGALELSDPVALKVYKRDVLIREQCPHDDYRFVVTPGVDPAEALDDDVDLSCPQCVESTVNENEPGTDGNDA